MAPTESGRLVRQTRFEEGDAVAKSDVRRFEGLAIVWVRVEEGDLHRRSDAGTADRGWVRWASAFGRSSAAGTPPGTFLIRGSRASGAAIAAHVAGAPSSLTVRLDGGELQVEISDQLDVRLTGTAQRVYSGELEDEFMEG